MPKKKRQSNVRGQNQEGITNIYAEMKSTPGREYIPATKRSQVLVEGRLAKSFPPGFTFEVEWNKWQSEEDIDHRHRYPRIFESDPCRKWNRIKSHGETIELSREV